MPDSRRFKVLWERSGDTFLRTFERSDGSPVGAVLDFNGSGSTMASDDSGETVVIWQFFEITGQRLTADNSTVGDPFQVNTSDALFLGREIDRAPEGEFVVAWTAGGNLDGDDYGVFARHFNQNGVPQGNDFQVNTQTVGSQVNPDVSMASDGSFVIAWNQSQGVFARRFTAGGSPIGGQFRIDQDLDAGYDPSLSHHPDGGFMVVWTVYGEEAGGQQPFSRGVFGRRYSSSGQPEGGSFQVNQHTPGIQRSAVVDHGPGGGQMVVWTSDGQDGSLDSIYARYYGNKGIPMGQEFQVNVSTSGNQISPAIAGGRDDRFLVAWENDFNHIEARVYPAPLFADSFETGLLNRWAAAVP